MSRHTLPVAVHVFLRDGDSILLLKRHNTGFEDGKYSVIAGHVEQGEQLHHAAIREAQEEGGVTILEQDLHIVGVMHRNYPQDRIDFFFTAHKWSGIPYNAEPSKCSDVRWCNIHNLPGDMVQYVRQAVLNYRNGKWFDTFGF